jgi:predicted DNA-binding transcriptional regulator YafY
MKNVLRERYTRPPSDRMRRIHEWIKGGKYPNAVTMGKDLEVVDRTVKRDIEFMRDRYGLPIAYDEERHGYYYTKPVDRFPVAAMTEAEMFALLVADKAIAQYHGTPFQKPLRMAFRKLTGQLDGREQYSLENLGLALSFRPFAPEDADLNTFRVVTRRAAAAGAEVPIPQARRETGGATASASVSPAPVRQPVVSAGA